jgi:hypothetical protein
MDTKGDRFELMEMSPPTIYGMATVTVVKKLPWGSNGEKVFSP